MISISIPDSVTTIKSYVFARCKNLTNISIPVSITKIEASAFFDCPISLIFYTGTREEWNEMCIGTDNGALSTAEIVYNATKKTYKFITNCEETLTDITDYAVMSMPNIKNPGKILTGWYDNEELTGEYRFYTKGNIDTYGYLYDSEKQRLTTNYDGGENHNFKITYNLTAGKKYYIMSTEQMVLRNHLCETFGFTPKNSIIMPFLGSRH